MPARRSGRTFSALFAIVVGCAMAGMWAMTLLQGAMPELASEPWAARAHLAAEFLTAAMLMASGIGLLLHRRWARSLHLMALGMLLYAVIQAWGFFLEQGQLALAAMFALLALMTVIDAAAILWRRAHPERMA